MQKFNGYEDIKINEGYEKIKLGGHICKILDAKVIEFTSPKDNKKYEQLSLKIDIAEPDEQAASILFLASDDASYMTGTIAATDGGWTAF